MTNDELPQGWAKAPIGKLIDLNPKTDLQDEDEVGFVPMPMIGTRFLERVRYETKLWRDVRKGYTHFQDGDVLLAKITPCFENGKGALVRGLPNGAGAGSTEYFVCRPKKDILEAKYLHAFFKTPSFMAEAETQMSGSVGHKRVPKDQVTATELPVAPLAEQKRIADKLEAVLGRVDACRARLDRVPDLLKRFRQSVLAAATSGQLTEDWRENAKMDTAGLSSSDKSVSTSLPDKWRVVELATVVKNHDNRRIPVKSSDRKRRAGTFPYYGAFGIIDSIDDFLFDGDYVLLAEDGKNLESRDRPIALIATGKFWVNNHAHVLQPKEELHIGYLHLSLNSPSLEIDSLLTGIDQIKLTRGAMDRIELNLPPLPEQQEIVRHVEALFAFADRIEARLTAARAQVERLTPATLAKAFCGELVPQDPNDEPASKLLERLETASSDKGQMKLSARKKR